MSLTINLVKCSLLRFDVFVIEGIRTRATCLERASNEKSISSENLLDKISRHGSRATT